MLNALKRQFSITVAQKRLCDIYSRHFSICSKDFCRLTDPDKPSETDSSQTGVQELLEGAAVSVSEEPDFASDIVNTPNVNRGRDQSRHSYRPRIDPRETSILLFPGQGSQFVGMGEKLLPFQNVKEMYDIASEILKYDLLELCLNGPKEKSDKTVYCQPAVLVTSLAAIEKLREENPKAISNCIATAGFSVGEYASLVFSGVLSLEDAVEIVKVRAEAMQTASETVPSGMMSVFLGPDHKVRFACLAARQYCQKILHMDSPECTIANYLYPECKVIAGNLEALDFIEKNARDFGIRRIKRLPVSGAFHSELMKPAAEALRKILQRVPLAEPIISVHSNVTSHRYHKEETIRKVLLQQLYKPVKWEQTMHVLYSRNQGQSFPQTFELGPGRQLGTILRMTNRKAFEQYRNIEV